MVLMKKILLLFVLFSSMLVVLALISYQALPPRPTPTHTDRPISEPSSFLAQHFSPQHHINPGLSGIYPLADGRDAFLARLALADSAQQRLDVQYYIWHNDISGHLLLQRLYQAAERGVKVRLLLDDNNTQGMDALFAALNAHPNFDIRLFNPFMQRKLRFLGYLSDFSRLNRRMHNKSFSADSTISIVGGRNIGDEYFDVGNGVLFADLDVAVVGKVVEDIEQDFERYWHSEAVYPLEMIVTHTHASPFNSTPSTDKPTQIYLEQLAQSPFARALNAGTLQFVWAPAYLMTDDPAKGISHTLLQHSVLADIAPTMLNAKQSLIIVSPYFVPTKYGVDFLSRIAQKGIEISILTNSLEATDVSVVHSGYAKYRKALLQQQIRLYELKPDATVQKRQPHPLLKGNSGASLHAKTFSVDSRYLFVGSFNMDPRSALINTEMGVLIDSPTLAAMLNTGLHTHQQHYAFHVELDANGELRWQTQQNGEQKIYQQEPHSTWFKRFSLWFLSLLPVEHLL